MEKWILEKINNLSLDAQSLFNESLLAYKINANRAALLFSYLGLLTIIKEIIISSKKPDGIVQTRWDKIIMDLNNEDLWEKRVFEEMVNSSNPIFNMTESVRQQIKYWKDRRNDCAHFKENEITNYHVEIFWNFIKSNLHKITIEGGMRSLLNKFSIHFDETKTPPDKDYIPLIKQIENAIEIKESEIFLKELNNVLEDSTTPWNERYLEIYKNLILHINNVQIRLKIINYIKSLKDFDLSLISEYSQLIPYFDYSEQDIRSIWKERMYKCFGTQRHIIFSILIRNGLIPANQIGEAFVNYYDNFDQEGYSNIPSSEEVKNQLANPILLQKVYDEFFEENTIATLKFQDINKRADLIELLFEYKKMDDKMVKGIVELYLNDINPWL